MFKKLLFLIITVLFTCSALELEIAEAEQTFFDAYDTYIPANPVTANKVGTVILKHKFTQKADFKTALFKSNSPFKANLNMGKGDYFQFLSLHPRITILQQKSELRI